MPVQLDNDKRPVAYSDNDEFQGEDIPLPPEPSREYRWTGGEWVHDPRQDANTLTKEPLAESLESGEMSTKEVLIALLRDGRI